MATLLLALAVLSTGLYAGFMLIFQTGIMPALARLTDEEFVVVMRRINECVPRPVFLLVFFGMVAFPAAAFLVPVDGRSDAQKWLLLMGLVSAALNHVVTVAGNVPLNVALAASENAPTEDGAARSAFEKRWNGFHRIRTALVVTAFGLVTAGAVA
ncbi:DUF1772 domain-containing protein [Streptomyces sp. NPDC056144]|uniref:anthrone oxygenase family protein n=1 Tax=unclassified Streptomyces TaxID=2593676 RepID=UPI0035D780C6